jgi:hypothetical protein
MVLHGISWLEGKKIEFTEVEEDAATVVEGVTEATVIDLC